ncbi:MAG: hypothetical protein QGG48_07860 [Desulfatiglandales bacterium]|nr:hypothetical protein [Desulfatiglandales bacterium]
MEPKQTWGFFHGEKASLTQDSSGIPEQRGNRAGTGLDDLGKRSLHPDPL